VTATGHRVKYEKWQCQTSGRRWKRQPGVTVVGYAQEATRSLAKQELVDSDDENADRKAKERKPTSVIPY
jgi:hypothetical protein